MALSPAEFHLLDLALARIMPVEDGQAMKGFVRARSELQPDLYRAGLMLLEARSFERISPLERDAVLLDLEAHPSIQFLVQHAVEGYYTSAAGLAEVGFRVTA